MAAIGERLESARATAVSAIKDYAAIMRRAEGPALGDALIQTRAMKDQLEAIFLEGLGRFDRSGEYKADGALDPIGWLRSKCKVSGGEAAERLGMARQLDSLPKTQQAFASGELGYAHVAVLARAAQHVGPAAMQRAEATLLTMAERMDPGQFTGVVRNFEHQVDAFEDRSHPALPQQM